MRTFYFNNIEFEKKLHYGSKNRNLDISNLRRNFPSFKFISIDQGISKTIRWCSKKLKNEMSIMRS